MTTLQKTGGRYDWRSWCQRRWADQLWRIRKHDDFLIWYTTHLSKDYFEEVTVVSKGVSAVYDFYILYLRLSTNFLWFKYITFWNDWNEKNTTNQKMPVKQTSLDGMEWNRIFNFFTRSIFSNSMWGFSNSDRINFFISDFKISGGNIFFQLFEHGWSWKVIFTNCEWKHIHMQRLWKSFQR